MEDFPFTTAHELLSEAAAWLCDMTLPTGHAERHEDADDVCLEQAVANVERASIVLADVGRERVEAAAVLVDGHLVPQYTTNVVYPQADAASTTIDVLTKDLVAWARGGPRVEMLQQLAEQLKTLMPANYGGELESESRAYKALADHADY